MSLVGVCILDPMATFFLPEAAAKLVVDGYARTFILLIAVGYSHCLMHEESKQVWISSKKG